MMSNLEKVMARFKEVKKDGKGYKALCPAHSDQNPSLSLKLDKTTGKILLHCHAGCEVKEILEATGLSEGDLFTKAIKYYYRDDNGNASYGKIRYEDKSFAFFHADESGKNIWSMGNQEAILYNRPGINDAVRNDEQVYIVEGEKDADTLMERGLTATTSPFGAAQGGKWNESYNECLTGADVVVLGDNDDCGRAFQRTIAKSLYGKAKSIKVIDMRKMWPEIPENGDISDFVEHDDLAIEKLVEFVDKTELYVHLPGELTKSEVDTAPGELKASTSAAAGSSSAAIDKSQSSGRTKEPTVGTAMISPAVKKKEETDSSRFPYRSDNIGMGKAFCDYCGKYVKYASESKVFYIYDNEAGVWREDKKGYIKEIVKRFVAEHMPALVSKIDNEEAREKWFKYIGKIQSNKERNDILESVKTITGFAITIEEFDAESKYLNLKNGVLDLESFALLKHAPEFLLTKCANVEYNPSAQCERFADFVDEIMLGDEDLKSFLQKSLGYAITGNPREDLMFIFYGATTRNGKSTLLNAVENVMGDYAASASPRSLGEDRIKSSSAPNGDLARLAGVRLVNMSEPEKGMKFNVALVKAMTGRDKIVARQLYKDFFEYTPSFVIIMNANHLPRVDDKTLFSSDRVYCIPFRKHFKPEERDTSLGGQFSAPKAASAIFNWLLEGYRVYIKEGMRTNIPKAVEEANDEYKLESDTFGNFLAENVLDAPGNFLSSDSLYRRYLGWVEDNGYRAMSKGSVSKEMKSRGYTEYRTAATRGFRDICLST